MKNLGLSLSGFGVASVIFAAFQLTSYKYSDAINIGLIADREMIYTIGVALLIAGVLFIIADALMKKLSELNRQKTRDISELKERLEIVALFLATDEGPMNAEVKKILESTSTASMVCSRIR